MTLNYTSTVPTPIRSPILSPITQLLCIHIVECVLRPKSANTLEDASHVEVIFFITSCNGLTTFFLWLIQYCIAIPAEKVAVGCKAIIYWRRTWHARAPERLPSPSIPVNNICIDIFWLRADEHDPMEKGLGAGVANKLFRWLKKYIRCTPWWNLH